jgi:hypothetical protein
MLMTAQKHDTRRSRKRLLPVSADTPSLSQR